MRISDVLATVVCTHLLAAGVSAQTPAPTPATTPAPTQQAPAAMSAEVKTLVDRMQAFYEKTADFRAEFEQTYSYRLSKRSQKSSGTVTFMKPALMRWDYEQPSKKTFVLAGDKIYMHDPDARTLTKASIGTSQLSASVTFLWGRGKLADEFSIAQAACKDCTGTMLELTPLKPDPRFKRIKLEVDAKTAQVLRSIVIDPDGSENAIRFKNLKTNVGADKTTFKIQPPEGTQVVDYTERAKP